MSQKIRVIQPITPAANAPSLAPLKQKNSENAIEIYHNALRVNQLAWNTFGLASSI